MKISPTPVSVIQAGLIGSSSSPTVQQAQKTQADLLALNSSSATDDQRTHFESDLATLAQDENLGASDIATLNAAAKELVDSPSQISAALQKLDLVAPGDVANTATAEGLKDKSAQEKIPGATPNG